LRPRCSPATWATYDLHSAQAAIVRDYLEQPPQLTWRWYMAPLGGVERTRRVVRFARLIHRRTRAAGVPLAGAAFGGDLRLTWLPRRVIRHG
jgi:hypothetical protein